MIYWARSFRVVSFEMAPCMSSNPGVVEWQTITNQNKARTMCIAFDIYFAFSSPSETWWRHQMGTFSALLAICAGNSPVTGELPVTRSFDVSFDMRVNKRLNKQSWGWWFETPSSSLWSHCNDVSSLFHEGGILWQPIPYYWSFMWSKLMATTAESYG